MRSSKSCAAKYWLLSNRMVVTPLRAGSLITGSLIKDPLEMGYSVRISRVNEDIGNPLSQACVAKHV
jgi:hypothetical protein